MHVPQLLQIIAWGLVFAVLFGAITNRLRLSPIVGYLLAGIAVGPHTPGFKGDPVLAGELAEVGVVLLMFGVGLHFHLDDLLRVRSIAVPGAVGQSLTAVVLCAVLVLPFGINLGSGVVLGLAVSVASTVVLIRVLMDAGVLHTPQGHVAVGWLVVEDLFTVIVVVLLPVVKAAAEGGALLDVAASVGLLVVKVVALLALVLVGGKRVVPALMNAVARSRSRELFTLTVLAVALGIAAASAVFFDVSMALGAFLAGMVVSQSDVSHQAAADALPMRDAFSVLFFVSVGMRFDPASLGEHLGLVLVVLLVVLVGKPLSALVIVLWRGHPVKTALTVAVALAQIGEFSFILGEQALALKLLDETAASTLVTCAIVSITLNPLVFRLVGPVERWLQSRPRVWHWLTARSRTDVSVPLPAEDAPAATQAVVIGYGPVGQTLTRLLRDFAIRPTVIDLNIGTIKKLHSEGLAAVYGDAGNKDILRAAGLDRADFLVLTLPDRADRYHVIEAARKLNPALKVIVRARYIGERAALDKVGVTAIAYEEAEVAVALAELLLEQIGVPEAELQTRTRAVRDELAYCTRQTAPRAVAKEEENP